MDTIKIENKAVKMVAHRGLSGIEKENTCSAFVAACNRATYFAVETDVHRTVDGQFVIFHDDNTARVGLDHLVIEESTFETLRKLQLVDIDGKSLKAFGVWPWDRTIHARLVEQLEDLGARQIAFDIDFSARSNPASDKAFAKAIGAAEVPVFLAAFRQNKAADDADIVLNRPIDLLAAEGWPALVNVPMASLAREPQEAIGF